MKISINNNNPIKIDAEFSEGINVIYGYSGTGKSFMFSRINDYYANSTEYKVSLIDYHYYNKAESIIIDFCRGSDLVLLDNADLYITHSLIDMLLKECKCIVISMKNTLFFDKNEANELSVEYINHHIRTIQR